MIQGRGQGRWKRFEAQTLRRYRYLGDVIYMKKEERIKISRCRFSAREPARRAAVAFFRIVFRSRLLLEHRDRYLSRPLLMSVTRFCSSIATVTFPTCGTYLQRLRGLSA